MIADAPRSAARRDPMGRGTFVVLLSVVTLAGVLVRVAHALRVPSVLGGDARWYYRSAKLLANGYGYVDPNRFVFEGDAVATTFKPPLYTNVLALASWLGVHSIDGLRLVGCVIGAATVVTIALVARKIAGRTAGICAAVLAATYPNLWMPDGLLVAETIMALGVALLLLCSYSYVRTPRRSTAVLFGGIVGATALARPEALLFIPLLFVPICLRARREGRVAGTEPTKAVLSACAATLVAMAPWLLFASLREGQPVLVSKNASAGFEMANCRTAYSGELLGYWDVYCLNRPPDQRGLAYLRGHLAELPKVIAAREGRVWDAYRTRQNAVNSALIDQRDFDLVRYGQLVYAIVVVLAVSGLVVVRRSRVYVWPLVVPIVVVAVVAAASSGEIRFRISGEVSMMVLGGIALARVVHAGARHDAGPVL